MGIAFPSAILVFSYYSAQDSPLLVQDPKSSSENHG